MKQANRSRGGRAVQPVSIVDFGSYLPGAAVGTDFFLDARPLGAFDESPLLRAPRARHHVGSGERAAEMIVRAAEPVFERLGIAPAGHVDLLITNVLLPDSLFTGSGAEAAHLLGCDPAAIIDLHNGGCASFPYMLKIAQAMIAGGEARTALLANVQNTAGQVFAQPGVRRLPHAATPGDGCGVAYVTADGSSPVLGVRTRSTPAFAMDLGPATGDGRKFWEPGAGELDVRFDQSKGAEIIERGNRLVPEVVEELCEDIGVDVEEIDVLVTNQPNRIFLRNWREALGLEPEQHLDTFDLFGNLYGAGVPVTIDHALRGGRIQDGDLVVAAGFAHAGDFAAAAAVRWHGGS
jgi:3-oxoacyl-[acyl-carrier-protein] synthase-3